MVTSTNMNIVSHKKRSSHLTSSKARSLTKDAHHTIAYLRSAKTLFMKSDVSVYQVISALDTTQESPHNSNNDELINIEIKQNERHSLISKGKINLQHSKAPSKKGEKSDESFESESSQKLTSIVSEDDAGSNETSRNRSKISPKTNKLPRFTLNVIRSSRNFQDDNPRDLKSELKMIKDIDEKSETNIHNISQSGKINAF